MAYDQLLSARKKTVGAKQTLKAVERGYAREVFIAKNADRHVVEPILKLCMEKGVQINEVDSMQALGKACGIEVGCAAASVIDY